MIYRLFIIIFLFSSSKSFAENSQLSELEVLEKQVSSDLEKINIPSRPWVLHSVNPKDCAILDVAIIGGGMAGMTAALALMKEGIINIKIFDENNAGSEGPWSTYARMNILRSPKAYMGPAYGIPSLTFRSWYEAQYGTESWDKLHNIPTNLWGHYLQWFRAVLKLPIENKMTLTHINPSQELLELTFQKDDGQSYVVLVRKVVLATGRDGCGQVTFPECMKGISRELYAHSKEIINAQSLVNKRIAIIGAGASSFDAAAMALENGAKSVEMIVRRSEIPRVNKFARFVFSGMANGFYGLSDEIRCSFFAEALLEGIPPPKETLDRIKDFNNLHMHYNTTLHNVVEDREGMFLFTNKGVLSVDFIIFATGFTVDLSLRPELDAIRSVIMLWNNRVPSDILQLCPRLGLFPYLGSHFEFLETEVGTAPYLKNIYCFNYGAFLSHGLISGDIPGISVGAVRLAQGIATDFFLEECLLYLDKVKNYDTPLFDPADYPSLDPTR